MKSPPARSLFLRRNYLKDVERRWTHAKVNSLDVTSSVIPTKFLQFRYQRSRIVQRIYNQTYSVHHIPSMRLLSSKLILTTKMMQCVHVFFSPEKPYSRPIYQLERQENLQTSVDTRDELRKN